jgi:tRNA(Leu) C34 or U34 (ribose-2'-O)-methylase TrmL
MVPLPWASLYRMGETMSPPRGNFSIGIYHPKTETNVGTLFRSAKLLGASCVFTVGRRYEKQSSDTCKTWRHMPVLHFKDWDCMLHAFPFAQKVCIEISAGATLLRDLTHPESALYILGAEDHGIPEALMKGLQVVQILQTGPGSLNVASAGTVVMYDRLSKAKP